MSLKSNEALYPEYPDEKVDSRDYIWYREFKVRIPRVDTYGEGYLKAVGVPLSGDERLDAVMRGEIITTYKSINGMVELFRNGGRIHIVGQENCLKIYRYIDNHLEKWRVRLSRSSVNQAEAPVDDLLLLDEFSEMAFQHARWNMVNGDGLNYLRRQMGTQYQFTVAAIQEAIPTLQAIKNKEINAKVDENGGGVRMADVNEVIVPAQSSHDGMDAFFRKASSVHFGSADIEKHLPKRESYARFFEQFREDKSFTVLAPTADSRFNIPTTASSSLNNKLGRG